MANRSPGLLRQSVAAQLAAATLGNTSDETLAGAAEDRARMLTGRLDALGYWTGDFTVERPDERAILGNFDDDKRLTMAFFVPLGKVDEARDILAELAGVKTENST